MNRMPSRLKWIIGIMLLGVAMQLVSIGMTLGGQEVTPRLISIVITIGVSKGLASGERIAWHIGRILNILALILLGFIALAMLVAQFNGISQLMVFVWFAVALIQSAFIFVALGAQDVRKFCGIKTKRKHSDESDS